MANVIDHCDICGYTTHMHLIHTGEGKCYCTEHYLLHVLNGDIEEGKSRKTEQESH